jgi:hypothetical protein
MAAGESSTATLHKKIGDDLSSLAPSLMKMLDSIGKGLGFVNVDLRLTFSEHAKSSPRMIKWTNSYLRKHSLRIRN